MSDLPRWAASDPMLALLVGAGLSLEQAYEKAERWAIVSAEWDAKPQAPAMVYGADEYRAALRAWDPSRGHMPIQGYSA